jgi:hypothetical protein
MGSSRIEPEPPNDRELASFRKNRNSKMASIRDQEPLWKNHQVVKEHWPETAPVKTIEDTRVPDSPKRFAIMAADLLSGFLDGT